MARVLVFAPHPDDEVIGCGGSLRLHALAGDDITIVTLVARLRSRLELDVSDAAYAEESRTAHRELGVKAHIDLALPGRELVVTPELLLELVATCRAECPDVVYLPHGGEEDSDHKRTHEAAVETMWMAQSPYFGESGPTMPPPGLVLGYEVWTPLAQYQYVADISDVIEDKVRAMRCYRSQLRHGAWDEAVRGLAAYRGVTAGGGGYAEVFTVLALRGSPFGHRL